MSKNKLKVIMIASAFSIISFSFFSKASFAQNAIAPDNTLPVNTLVNFNSANQTYTITGGTQVGGNQFHSFQDFSVPTSNTAHFDTAPTTINAIGRVTGSNISNIDGILRTNGTTNLYLVNPNGIVFGANAKLDIAGSFSASTANSVKFSDGSEFSATNPQAPPLLNVNVPLGLQYGNSNAGATISNSGNLSAGQDLVLNADKLDLQGTLQSGRDLTLQAQDLVNIRDTSTSPFFAVAGRDLLIQGNQLVDIFTFNHRNSGFWSGGNMLLRSQNPVIGDAHFYAGKNLKIEKLNGNLGNLISPNDPVILANGDVSLGDYTGASLHILAGGSVTLGNVTIDSTGDIATTINPNNTTLFNATRTYADLATFNLTGYQVIKNSDGSVNTFVPVAVPITVDGSQKATLDVRAGVDWSQLGGLPTSQILGSFAPANTDPTFVSPPNNANITVNGNIRVDQPNGLVLLTNQFRANSLTGVISVIGIDTSSSLAGENGGDIGIYGRGDIAITDGFLRSRASVYTNAGNAGAISLSTSNGNISLANSSLSSDSFVYMNAGNGGAISLSASNGNISLANSDLRSGSRAYDNVGNGGAISFFVANGNILLTNSSVDSSVTSFVNIGNGGAISYTAYNGNISLYGSSSDSSSTANNVSQGSNPGDVGLKSVGNGGEISLSTSNGNISLTGVHLNSSSSTYGGQGTGGKISLSTLNGNISLIRSSLSSDSSLNNNFPSYFRGFRSSPSIRNGGAISFFAANGNISLTNSSVQSFSRSYSYGPAGNGGGISYIASNGNILLDNSTSYSYSISSNDNAGNGGAISFSSKYGSIIGSASSLWSFATSLDSSKTSAHGGDVTLIGKTQISNLEIFTQSLSTIAGEVNIKGTGDLTLTNLEISTSKSVSIPDPTSVSGFITFAPGANGQSGNVTVTGVGNLTFDTTRINSNSDGIKPAGNINITSPTKLTFQNNSQIQAIAISVGKAGDINVNAPIVEVNDGSQILAETKGAGTGGDITINASTSVALTRTLDSFPILSVETSNAGKAGNIIINTPTLTLSDSARITATATATATNLDGGGSVTLNASQMNLFGTVGVFAETQGFSPAGTLKLDPYGDLDYINIALATNSQISASTSSVGRGGDLLITAPQSIYIAGQGKLAVSTSGQMDNAGKAGNITFTTSQLTLTDGVLVSASTSGRGKAGDIFVRADDFTISNGARIETATASSGDSGIIDVRVVNQINLAGAKTGLFANTLANSTGKGGDIFIDPVSVILRDGAQIAVGSLGAGIGGNITLISNFLTLLNGSSITAETASANGGNITLNIPSVLLLRSGSQISTTAGTALAGGNGGNINITAGFIVALPKENSDIFANAFTGNGGNIKGASQFGTE
jgi:filamentous hemagglutinin family protein